jgi:ElaB/YqjD/DUF883 family membrane-anchored ribosome-binding protein
MTKNTKTTVEMVNEAIDQADLDTVAREEAARLGEEAARLKEFTDKLAKDVERRVGEGIETFQRIAREAGDRLSTSAAVAGDQAKKAYEESQSYVRANPTTTILGAFALGVLLGAIIRRK